MAGRLQVIWCVVLVAVAVSALPAAALAESSTVSIAVRPTQRVEGATSLVVSADAPLQRGRLIVKSNTSWVLVARTSGTSATVAWRTSGETGWQQLGAATPVLSGGKGIREVEYEIRIDPHAQRSGQPVMVTFSVEPR